MLALGELMEQREELNRKKVWTHVVPDGVQKDTRGISEITYRQNSGIDAGYGQEQGKTVES